MLDQKLAELVLAKEKAEKLLTEFVRQNQQQLVDQGLIRCSIDYNRLNRMTGYNPDKRLRNEGPTKINR